MNDIDKNLDLHENHRTMWWLLLVYLFAWVIARIVSDGNLDPAGNMLENYAWGQQFTWGTAKHPPLIAWIAASWFEVFPNNNGFYHVLAYVISAVGLLGTYHLGNALGLRHITLPATLLLSIALPYSTLAVKFNANTVLLAIWPWLAWSWVQAVGKRRLREACLLGVLSALAILGKYYSAIFLLTLAFTSLSTDAGCRWLLSKYFIIAAAIALILLTPHFIWLVDNNFATLHYVEGKGQGGADVDGWLRFAISPFVYWLIPWAFIGWLCTQGNSTGERLRRWPANLLLAWKPTKKHSTLFAFAFAPWVITLFIGATGFVNLRSHWAIPIGFAFPLLWLSNLYLPTTEVERITRGTQRFFFGWLALIVVLAPVYAWQQAVTGQKNFYRPRSEAAQRLLSEWERMAPGQRLGWVSGEWAESSLLAFYGDDRIRAIHGFPGEFPATLIPLKNWQNQPGLILCPLGQPTRPNKSDCSNHARAWFKSNEKQPDVMEITVTRTGFRFPLARPFQYRAFFYLPELRTNSE